MKLPKEVKRLFWDIDTNKSSPHKHRLYYTTRILDKGDKSTVSWLFKIFGKEVVKQSIPKARLSPRSANYWQKFFRLT